MFDRIVMPEIKFLIGKECFGALEQRHDYALSFMRDYILFNETGFEAYKE